MIMQPMVQDDDVNKAKHHRNLHMCSPRPAHASVMRQMHPIARCMYTPHRVHQYAAQAAFAAIHTRNAYSMQTASAFNHELFLQAHHAACSYMCAALAAWLCIMNSFMIAMPPSRGASSICDFITRCICGYIMLHRRTLRSSIANSPCV